MGTPSLQYNMILETTLFKKCIGYIRVSDIIITRIIVYRMYIIITIIIIYNNYNLHAIEHRQRYIYVQGLEKILITGYFNWQTEKEGSEVYF